VSTFDIFFFCAYINLHLLGLLSGDWGGGGGNDGVAGVVGEVVVGVGGSGIGVGAVGVGVGSVGVGVSVVSGVSGAVGVARVVVGVVGGGGDVSGDGLPPSRPPTLSASLKITFSFVIFWLRFNFNYFSYFLADPLPPI